VSAHPEDILVVAWPEEARRYPQFLNKQVFNVASPRKLEGRRFRRAYTTQPAVESAADSRFWQILFREAYFCNGEIKHIDEYKDGE
jgi:hypothetical protein